MHDFFSRIMQHAGELPGRVVSVILWTLAFTAPVHTLMVFMVVLIATDCVTGIWASRKRGEPFSISYLMRTAISSKAIPYWVAVLSAHLVEQKFLPEVPLLKSTASFLAIAELGSIMMNLGEITGLKIWESLKSLLQPTRPSDPK